MPGRGKLALAVVLAAVICCMAATVATAEQISMITGRVTVNGAPQANAFVTGFGSSATTDEDGVYVLKFESIGYGVINASYNGYNASSGLIVLPTSPLIRARDLDIAIPGYSPRGNDTAISTVNATSTPAPTVWTKVFAPTGVPEPVREKVKAPDGTTAIYMIAGLACVLIIGFAAYLTMRK